MEMVWKGMPYSPASSVLSESGGACRSKRSVPSRTVSAPLTQPQQAVPVCVRYPCGLQS